MVFLTFTIGHGGAPRALIVLVFFKQLLLTILSIKSINIYGF